MKKDDFMLEALRVNLQKKKNKNQCSDCGHMFKSTEENCRGKKNLMFRIKELKRANHARFLFFAWQPIRINYDANSVLGNMIR